MEQKDGKPDLGRLTYAELSVAKKVLKACRRLKVDRTIVVLEEVLKTIRASKIVADTAKNVGLI